MVKKLLFGILATYIVFMIGFFGFSASLSDLGPGETWAIRMASVYVVSLVGSLGVGALLYKWWPVAVACSWGVLLGGAMLDSSYFQVAMFVVPILCLLGGFAGYQLIKLLLKRKKIQG